ncbi:unnamed protein product [Closterium sp. Naga37s-1]|nr:unnamed protein product [Closterium sp. Naga37s-1]
MMDPPYAATCTIYSAKHAATVGLAAPNAAISAAWNMAASALSPNVAETASAQEATAAEGRATVTETAEVAEVGSTPEAMRELRAEVLIPLLLQAAQRKKQAQETRGEGDKTQQDARQEAEAGRNEGWDVTARGEGAGEAIREVEGERRNGVREHGEKAEINGRGVSAARCLKFVRITDVTETDQSTANRHHNSDADDREAGSLQHPAISVRLFRPPHSQFPPPLSPLPPPSPLSFSPFLFSPTFFPFSRVHACPDS